MSDLDEGSLGADESEYLDPGYDAQTPDGDNLLLDFCRADVALWTSWGQALGAVHGGDSDGTFWVDSGSPTIFGNPVLWTRPLDSAAATATVDRQREVYSQRAGAGYLLYSAFPTPDLSRLGLQPVGHPPCMVLMPGVGDVAASPAALTISRVESSGQLADFEQTFVEAYSIPDLMPWRPSVFMGRDLLDDPRWHMFVGHEDGVPVATAASYVTEHAVDVTMVSCRAESRGRGYGRAITQAAVDADRSKPAMLLSSDSGQSVYRSMGFHTMTRFSLWIGQRLGHGD